MSISCKSNKGFFICRSGSEKPFICGSAALSTQGSRKVLFSNTNSIYSRKVCSGHVYQAKQWIMCHIKIEARNVLEEVLRW